MLLLLSPWKLDLLHPSQVWWGFSQWPDWRLPWLQQVSEPTGRKKSHKTAQNHFCLCSPPPSTPHVSPHPHSHPPTPSHSHQYKRDYITTATVWASWDKDTVYIYFLLFTDWYRRLCCSNTAVSKGGEFLVVLHTKCGCGALWGRKGGNTVSHEQRLDDKNTDQDHFFICQTADCRILKIPNSGLQGYSLSSVLFTNISLRWKL